MRPMFLSRRSRTLVEIVFTLSLAGCDGTVKTDLGSATNGGASSTAGAASAAAGSGGTGVGVGGTASAAGGTGGRAQGTAGSSGAASGGDLCSLPWVGGDCDAAIPRYWHNPVSGQCELRTYGGCGGNANRFDTIEGCIAACSMGDDPNTTCNQMTDCELRSPSCCGACEPIEASSLVAVNHAAPTTTCNLNCGACPPVPPNESTSRYFIPACIAHRCAVVDIRESPITECETTTDCTLRNTAACCNRCGASGDPIAYNTSIDQVTAFCGGTLLPCPACVGGIPQGFITECQAGRCVVELVK